jgi:hypothetical protein
MSAQRLLVMLGLAAALPAAAGAQEASRRCQLQLDHADRGFADGNNYFAAGDVRISCRGGSVRMRSDSLASYSSQIVNFVGNVRYEDSTMTMDAERGTYLRAGERWEARGNVFTRNLRTGSTLKGPSLDYYRAIPGERDTLEVYAIGRPTISYMTLDSAGQPREPYLIVGDRVRMKGEDRVWAGGKVTIDRSDFAARADSMRLDQGAGQDGTLLRGAEVRGLGTDTFALTGRRIDLRLEQSELTYVVAKGSSHGVSTEWDIVADTLALDINRQKIEQTLAWGDSTRPHAVSVTYEILADSLALDSPAQVLTEARAFGKAWVASQADSATRERDWLVGDSVTAQFARQDSAGKPRTVLSRVDARHEARSFYQVRDAARPGRPSLNYARGDRIVVVMRTDSIGGVDRVELRGQVDGVQLEPVTTAARDTTAAKPGQAPAVPR